MTWKRKTRREAIGRTAALLSPALEHALSDRRCRESSAFCSLRRSSRQSPHAPHTRTAARTRTATTSDFSRPGVWNSVGSCSYNPAHCCASGDGDPIDRDVTACPSASNCADTSCTAHSQCSSTEYCYDYGKYTTGTWSGVGYCTGDAYLCCAGYDADPIDRDTSNCPTQSYCGSTTGCTAHRHCASTEYCYDTGFFITGVWNGEGQCSMWTYACCGNADADPIDRDVANCPASAGCTSVTSTASNCKEVCEDMNYGRTHCLAVSSSCSWDGTACKSSVGTGSCTYYPNQSSSAVPRIVNAVLFAIAAAIALMLD